MLVLRLGRFSAQLAPAAYLTVELGLPLILKDLRFPGIMELLARERFATAHLVV